MVEIDVEQIERELEQELPGIEVDVIGDGGQITIIPKYT